MNRLEKKDIKVLRKIVGKDHLLTSRNDRLLYGYDASLETGVPEAVALPSTSKEVGRLVKYCFSRRIGVIARGAGTNRSGGTVPVEGGLVVVMTRMDRILEISSKEKLVVVEPGVVTQRINDRLREGHEGSDLFYPPDPASMKVSTIGGNLAENAGGPSCLKYGVTADHVLGLEFVDGTGETVRLGGRLPQRCAGDNLIDLVVGSEGTLGIITRAVLRLVKAPEALETMLVVFDKLSSAGDAVSEVISSGVLRGISIGSISG